MPRNKARHILNRAGNRYALNPPPLLGRVIVHGTNHFIPMNKTAPKPLNKRDTCFPRANHQYLLALNTRTAASVGTKSTVSRSEKQRACARQGSGNKINRYRQTRVNPRRLKNHPSNRNKNPNGNHNRNHAF
jgi:hypothetical protein